MNKLYAVVFDNDPESNNTLQFCNVSNDEHYLEGSGSNVTEDLKYAESICDMCKHSYPNLNYRVVEIIVKELS